MSFTWIKATSDRLPYLFLVFVMAGAVCAIFASILVMNLWSSMKAQQRGAPPTYVTCEGTVCTEAPIQRLWWAGSLKIIELSAVSVLLIAIGSRRRVVWMDEPSRLVRISWGDRFSLKIKDYQFTSFRSTSIQREQRYMIMPLGGSSGRASRLPDRWRLCGALENGRRVNLGSYATEAEAQKWAKFIGV